MEAFIRDRKIIDLEIDGIDRDDHPKYCDAFIAKAIWADSGKELNEDELEELSEQSDIVNELAHDSLY